MRPWIEHVAIYVSDLDWHLTFFREALGMDIVETQPGQVWIGGFQLTQSQAYAPNPQRAERMWHVGVNVADLSTASAYVRSYPGVEPFSTDLTKENWFVLPEGLVIELVCK